MVLESINTIYLIHDLTCISNILGPFVQDICTLFGTPHSAADCLVKIIFAVSLPQRIHIQVV